MTMAVALAEDLWWIPTCEPVDGDPDRHVHASVYLLAGPTGWILVDAGPPDATAIRTAVDELTDGAGVDTIVMTHTNLPHAGDIGAHDARVLSATDIPDEFGGYGEFWKLDETHDVCGRAVSFIKPPMTDHVYSLWVFDHGTGTLFVSEALGNYHRAGDCETVWDGPETAVDAIDLDDYCRDRLPWLQYVVPVKFRSTLERRLDGVPVELVAPSHGTPVAGRHLDVYVDRLMAVTEAIAADWPLQG